MEKYQKELLETKTKYELNFKETITDEYKKRQAIYFFENGYGISVINIIGTNGEHYSYTKNKDQYEIAVLEGSKNNSRITYDTVITDDVIGYLGIEGVYKIMEEIEKLK